MPTSVLTTHAELADLAGEWRTRLDLRTPYSGPAYALEWLAEHSEASPSAVAVRDPDGALVALAPWCLVSRGSGMRVLTGIGADEIPNHDPIFAGGIPIDALAAEIAEGLRKGPIWDVALLALGGDVLSPLRRRLGSLGWSAEISREWAKTYLVQFRGAWEEYVGTCSRSIGRKIRSLETRLRGHTSRFVEADASTWDAMLDRLFSLHRGRFGHTRNWNPIYRQMRAVAGEALARRELGLFALEVDGEVAALELSVRRDDRAYTLMCAYEPQFERFSAGTLLRAHTLERWYRHGLRTIDLGPGEFAWKEQFRAVGVPSINLLVARRHSLAASCFVAWESVLKPALRPTLRSLVRARGSSP